MAIDLRFRIQKVGRYNAGIDICDKCHEDLTDYKKQRLLDEHVINNVIGFFEHNGLWYTTVECPHCFNKYFFHLRDAHKDVWYELFKESIELGTQLHFKSIHKNIVAEHE